MSFLLFKPLRQLSDEELMLRASRGSESAFEELYRRYARRLQGFFFRQLGGDELTAADFTHDVFLRVYEARDRYAEGSVFTRELREVRPFEAATTHEPVNGVRPQNIRIAAQPNYDITGIKTIELDETEGTWFSIDGRQIQGQPQRKGVYLQNGKKVVIK